jgi:hypothetical protein
VAYNICKSNKTKEANQMTNLIEEITNSSNFEKIFICTTGELCKLSSVLYKAEEFAQKKLTCSEKEELKDYFIEHIKGNAQAKAEELIENQEAYDVEFEQEWLDKYVDLN